jgi:hypothetical protein
LPVQAQLSPVYAIHIADLDNDGKEDMLLGGNINHPRLRLGKSAASYGTFLKGDGKGNFSYIPQMNSGLNIRGDMRSILQLGDMIVFGINQDKLRVYIKNKK